MVKIVIPCVIMTGVFLTKVFLYILLNISFGITRISSIIYLCIVVGGVSLFNHVLFPLIFMCFSYLESFPTVGVCLLYKRGDCFSKWGELSFRGRNLFRGQVLLLLPIWFNMSSFLMFDSKGGEIYGQNKPKFIKYKNHQFKILWPTNWFIIFQMVAYGWFWS
jgi:hypothetical protein